MKREGAFVLFVKIRRHAGKGFKDAAKMRLIVKAGSIGHFREGQLLKVDELDRLYKLFVQDQFLSR